MKEILKNYRGTTLGILIWFLGSLLVSLLISDSSLFNSVHSDSEGNKNIEAVSNIFGVIFTILVGIGTFFITYFSTQSKDLLNNKKEEFLALRPFTVEEFFLEGLKNGDLSKIDEDKVGSLDWITKDQYLSEFIWVQKGLNFYNLVHDILRKTEKERPLLFILENCRNLPVVPNYLYILYKKVDIHIEKNKKKRVFIDEEGNFINEILSSNGIVESNKKPIFVYATDDTGSNDDEYGSVQQYNNFYKHIKINKQFIIILSFSLPGKPNNIMNTMYKATVVSEKIDYNTGKKSNKEIYYIKYIDPIINKNDVTKFVTDELIEKYNIFTVD